MMAEGYPLHFVSISGAPHERGVQYGQQAKEQVHHNVAIYREMFQHYLGLSWKEILPEAAKYISVLKRDDPDYLEEIQGIADGAGLRVEEVIALNVRTELRFGMASAGCTSVFVNAEATGGPTLIGQNWDWRVTVEQPPKPTVMMVTEAGMIAKTGFNSAGVALCNNFLGSDKDRRGLSAPFHVVLRRILDSATPGDAVASVIGGDRASSANYLIGSQSGDGVDLEAAPDFVDFFYPENGVLVHTNHFNTIRHPVCDTGRIIFPDSIIRYNRMRRLLSRENGRITIEDLQKALRDHVNHPNSICRHGNPRDPEAERFQSVFSLVMDLDSQTMWVAAGPPCQHEYQPISLT
jgi:isopenicillin-N N-acyltransferase-like protein